MEKTRDPSQPASKRSKQSYDRVFQQYARLDGASNGDVVAAAIGQYLAIHPLNSEPWLVHRVNRQLWLARPKAGSYTTRKPWNADVLDQDLAEGAGDASLDLDNDGHFAVIGWSHGDTLKIKVIGQTGTSYALTDTTGAGTIKASVYESPSFGNQNVSAITVSRAADGKFHLCFQTSSEAVLNAPDGIIWTVKVDVSSTTKSAGIRGPIQVTRSNQICLFPSFKLARCTSPVIAYISCAGT